jgi:hypothetical protein
VSLTSKQEQYYELKRHRLCTKCKSDMDRDGAYCSKCTRNNTTKGSREKWRQTSLALGLCDRCGTREREVLANGKLGRNCTECGRKRAATQKDRYRASHPEVKKLCHCGRCGQPGHNSRGCRWGQADAEPLTIDEYATARKEWT